MIASGAKPCSFIDFISANYPGKDIAAAFREEDEYTVILVNGIELTFDLDGNLLEADHDSGDDFTEEEGFDDDADDPESGGDEAEDDDAGEDDGAADMDDVGDAEDEDDDANPDD